MRDLWGGALRRDSAQGARALKPRPILRIKHQADALCLLPGTAEYAEVQRVRDQCYEEAGKLSPFRDESLKEFSRSHLYGVRLGKAWIGTVRITIPVEGDLLPCVDKKLGFYPASLPAKEKVIEVSSLCILRGFRRSDVLKAVYELVHRELVRVNRSHILISSDERLRRKYRFIGFRSTGYRYRQEWSRFKDLEILISNQKPFGTYGLHADPIRWNFFLREVTDELIAQGILRHNRTQRIIFSFYRSFRGASEWVERLVLWRSRRI